MTPNEPTAATCDCGHSLGQHNHGGPCIECACPYFDDRDEAATDRSAARDRETGGATPGADASSTARAVPTSPVSFRGDMPIDPPNPQGKPPKTGGAGVSDERTAAWSRV